MTERDIAELYRAATAPPDLSGPADAQLAAALVGGSGHEREAGLELLAQMPQGPALARVMAALEGDAERLATELRARRQPAGRPSARRQLGPVVLALAATVASVAVIVGGIGSVQQPQGADDAALRAALADDDPSTRIVVASFEGADDADPANPAVPAEGKKIFRGGFDS